MPLLQALASTFLISLIPNALLVAVPTEMLLNKSTGVNMRFVLLGFAAGGMLGDVFLHSIPHLLGSAVPHDDHKHQHEHEHEDGHEHEHDKSEHGHGHALLWVGLMVLAGYLLFFVAERVASLRLGGSHSHAHTHDSHKDSEAERFEEDTSRRGRGRGRGRSKSANPKANPEVKAKATASTPSAPSPPPPGRGLWFAMATQMGPTGWLNLLADAAHNFTDGVAIGAACSGAGSLATVKFLAVLFHEVPHEIGDFAILVHSGLTKWQAIQAQFVTALAAFAGTLLGYSFSQLSHSSEAALTAVTSGGFLYIATSIMASVGTDAYRRNTLPQILCETLGFLCGVATMVIVALLE